jgi:hypothetical protein
MKRIFLAFLLASSALAQPYGDLPYGGYPYGGGATAAAAVLAAPSLSAADIQSYATVYLSWTAVTGATGYKVYKDGAEVYDQAGITKLVTGLSPGTVYAFTVKAYNASGNSAASNTSNATTPAMPVLDSLAALGETAPDGWWALAHCSNASLDSICRIRRDSDNAELNVGWVRATNLVDAATMASFIAPAPGTGAFVTLYDQVGANDLTFATAANQPDITLTDHGASPSLTFLRANSQELAVASTSFANVSTDSAALLAVMKTAKLDAFSHIIIGKRASSANVNGYAIMVNATEQLAASARQGSNVAQADGSDIHNNVWRTVTMTWENPPFLVTTYINAGAFDDTTANSAVTTLTNAAPLTVGSFADGSLPMTGNTFAYGVWTGTRPTSVTRGVVYRFFLALE